MRAAANVNGLNDEPAGYPPSTALLKIWLESAGANGSPARVMPRVMALGLNAGALARAHTSPDVGSTTAVAACPYPEIPCCAASWISGRSVIAMSAPATISVSYRTWSTPLSSTATRLQPGVPQIGRAHV